MTATSGICVECHGDEVDRYCARCGSLIKLNAAVMLAEGTDAVDWPAYRRDTARLRKENDARRLEANMAAGLVQEICCAECQQVYTLENSPGADDLFCPACAPKSDDAPQLVPANPGETRR